MERKEFFEGDTKKPSVISVVVDQCTEAFENAPWVNLDDEEELATDICGWVRELEGGDPVRDRLNAMLQGNPGWEMVIAKRVIRKLRERAA